MFTTLLETNPRRARSSRDAALSAGIHALLIASAIALTANTHVAVARGDPTERPVFTIPRTSPPVATPVPPNPTASNPRLPGPPVVTVIIPTVEVPGTLPAPSTVDPFPPGSPSTTPAPGAPASAAAPGGTNGSWTEWQVEKPAIALPGALPLYPDMLRAGGIEGEVVAQFVVDTLGRVEPGSFHSVRASHALFAASVERALSRLRFVPAEAGGRRVRQLVQQPFQFAITR